MNANFRRDYLYIATETIVGVVKENTTLRYLKFNRSTQEYIFLTGSTPFEGEKLVALPKCFINKGTRTIKRQYWEGYERTKGYDKRLGNILKDGENVRLGDRLLFTRHDSFYIHTEKTLKVTDIKDGMLYLRSDKGLNQRCDFISFDNGSVSARIVA